ncbi:hypothetical protein GMRT_15097 [Giardia muris]|uniref:Uncharacterized protein n=1 Tax=Giardia muris TaxID=5742 RepID=A0A4Z1SN04_GIAMU|nr:hypothetical protein GMRT_15097 [Giardia muris]|eukprot:TNJ26970.1 hypothetical protein GMRT_15097 [Giardia muris]
MHCCHNARLDRTTGIPTNQHEPFIFAENVLSINNGDTPIFFKAKRRQQFEPTVYISRRGNTIYLTGPSPTVSGAVEGVALLGPDIEHVEECDRGRTVKLYPHFSDTSRCERLLPTRTADYIKICFQERKAMDAFLQSVNTIRQASGVEEAPLLNNLERAHKKNIAQTRAVIDESVANPDVFKEATIVEMARLVYRCGVGLKQHVLSLDALQPFDIGNCLENSKRLFLNIPVPQRLSPLNRSENVKKFIYEDLPAVIDGYIASGNLCHKTWKIVPSDEVFAGLNRTRQTSLVTPDQFDKIMCTMTAIYNQAKLPGSSFEMPKYVLWDMGGTKYFMAASLLMTKEVLIKPLMNLLRKRYEYYTIYLLAKEEGIPVAAAASILNSMATEYGFLVTEQVGGFRRFHLNRIFPDNYQNTLKHLKGAK